MTKLEISEPVLIVAENKSTSTFATTVVPYYGSRAPKQSVIETDRIILEMIDDIQATIQPQVEWDNIKIVPMSTTRKNIIFWKLRIVLCAIILLLLVVATVVISELTKERS